MNKLNSSRIAVSGYDQAACDIGVVHLGYGAFHRAHQAVFLDAYMDQTGDLGWGIAAVNLRGAESAGFAQNTDGQNGYLLKSAYLLARGMDDLHAWVADHAAFPCSMVDRITPRTPDTLADELSQIAGEPVRQPIMAEAFTQWVIEDNFAADMPDLAAVGVTVTKNVDPFEETKIRVLNGGHTCLAYLAALQGIKTFDQAMMVPALYDHFWAYETQEVLPALTLDLPFSKDDYLTSIAARFKNPAIADTVARICADGFAKFAIFIRPTLAECLDQGIMPHHGITSIASWYVFSQHVAAGKIDFDYIEPSWDADVMHGVDLDIEDGEFAVFVGPSGCGKSTLLRMIAGLEEITSGTVAIDGEEMNDVAPAKRGVAMVFQTYALYPHMTVYNNMAFGLKQIKTPKE